VGHFDETALGGDFLADQPPLLEMANWAPKIIDLLDRMGVPFNRTPEGQRACAYSADRSSSAPSSPARRPVSNCSTPSTNRPAGGKRRGWSTSSSSGNSSGPSFTTAQCVGIVAQDMRTMQIRAFRADAVVMATAATG
jgi:succinate dehydrogenase / fumarate reductase flavoprotein subunit